MFLKKKKTLLFQMIEHVHAIISIKHIQISAFQNHLTYTAICQSIFIFTYTNIFSFQAINYKPDSKKVGTLYKLWIKKECNNLQIS